MEFELYCFGFGARLVRVESFETLFSLAWEYSVMSGDICLIYSGHNKAGKPLSFVRGNTNGTGTVSNWN